MRVIGQSPDSLADIKGLVAEDEEFLRALVRMALQEVLEGEMPEVLGAEMRYRCELRPNAAD